MIITHKLKMSLEGKETIKWIEVPQGDVNTREIKLALFAQKRPWVVPQDAVILICYRKPDGTRGEYDTLPDGNVAWSAAKNEISFQLAPQVLTAAGSVILQVSIRREEKVLHTFPIEICVRGTRSRKTKVETSKDYQYMTKVLPGPNVAEVGQYLSVAAVDAMGRVTQVKAVSENGSMFTPDATVTQTDTGAVISITDKNGTTTAVVNSGKDGVSGVYVGSGEMPEGYNVQIDPSGETDVIPTKLPNPNALTFTGAVQATYDGSEPVTVEIPSGGIDVSSATVGQIVVVKEVDENGKPTAWEAVDLPSGGDSGGETFELIASGELAEETTTINITADNNGNAFQLRRAQFMIKIVGTATNTVDRGNLRIRHNYNTAAKGSSVSALARIRNSELTSDLYGVYEFFPDIPWGALYYPTPANANNTHLYANYDTDWDNSPYLSALYLYGETANANTMGVGTKWELWGVRA